jgi:molybdopterin/thiamine biosynthesis adenylyltransferase
VGTLQAVEVLKLLLGVGQPLIGRMLHYDALATTFTVLTLRQNPRCAYCGAKPFPGYVDYSDACSPSSS